MLANKGVYELSLEAMFQIDHPEVWSDVTLFLILTLNLLDFRLGTCLSFVAKNVGIHLMRVFNILISEEL